MLTLGRSPAAWAVEAIYKDAASKIDRAVNRALIAGNDATAAYLRRQYVAIVAAADAATREARPLLEAGIMAEAAAGARIGKIGARVPAGEPPRPGQAMARANFGGVVNVPAVEAIAVAADARLASIPGTIGRQAADVFREIGVQAVGAGVAGGQTRREVSKRIERDLRHRGLTGFVARNGARWPLDRYASMVARTTTREAMTAGTLSALTDAGEDLVEVSSHGTQCDVCAEYEGNTYSLSGEDDRFDPLDEVPPFHPNCLHVLLPAGATFAEAEAAAAESGPPGDTDVALAEMESAGARRAGVIRARAKRIQGNRARQAEARAARDRLRARRAAAARRARSERADFASAQRARARLQAAEARRIDERLMGETLHPSKRAELMSRRDALERSAARARVKARRAAPPRPPGDVAESGRRARMARPGGSTPPEAQARIMARVRAAEQLGAELRDIEAGGPRARAGVLTEKPGSPAEKRLLTWARGIDSNDLDELSPGEHVNPTYKATVSLTDSAGGSVSEDVFIKPLKSTAGNLRSGIPAGHDGERERAAYLIAKRLKLDTPATVIADVEGLGPSIVQEWVPDASEAVEVLRGPMDIGGSTAETIRAYQQIGLFDEAIGNVDRHAGNWFVREADDMPVAIDHGLAWPEGPTYGNTYVQDWRAVEFPELTRAERKQLLSLLDPEVNRELLEDAHLPRSAVQRFRDRVARMLATDETHDAMDSLRDEAEGFVATLLGKRGAAAKRRLVKKMWDAIGEDATGELIDVLEASAL